MDSSSYTYIPVDLDDELYLSDLPLDVLEDAIRTQFDNPLEYRKKDYLQSFITRYEFSKENLEDTEDGSFDIEQYHDLFIGFMTRIFDDYLGVGFVDIDNKSSEDMNDIVHIAYRFFIKNIKRNFVNIVRNYIKENEKELSETLTRKKDVTTLAFKSEIDDDFTILILSNMGEVVERALDSVRDAFDIDEFLNYCEVDEPVFEVDFIREAYDSMDITGNFLEKYVDMVDKNFRIEIESKIRNILLKDYPNRVKREEDDDSRGEEEGREEESEAASDIDGSEA